MHPTAFPASFSRLTALRSLHLSVMLSTAPPLWNLTTFPQIHDLSVAIMTSKPYTFSEVLPRGVTALTLKYRKLSWHLDSSGLNTATALRSLSFPCGIDTACLPSVLPQLTNLRTLLAQEILPWS